jgi:ribosomal protein S3AE
MTRRKHSKMDGVYDVQTRDGYVVRIKSMAITEKRIQSAQEKLLRKLTGDTITKIGSSSTLAELVKSVISGELAKSIFKSCKPIYPIKRVDISKSRILRRVEGAQDIPLIEEKKAGEAAAPTPEGGAPPAPVTPVEPAKDERSPEEMLDEEPKVVKPGG